MPDGMEGGVQHLLRLTRTQCRASIAFVALHTDHGTIDITSVPAATDGSEWSHDALQGIVRETLRDPFVGHGRAVIRVSEVSRRNWPGERQSTRMAVAPLSDAIDHAHPWGLLCALDPTDGQFSDVDLDMLGRLAVRVVNHLHARKRVLEDLAALSSSFTDEDVTVAPAATHQSPPDDLVISDLSDLYDEPADEIAHLARELDSTDVDVEAEEELDVEEELELEEELDVEAEAEEELELEAEAELDVEAEAEAEEESEPEAELELEAEAELDVEAEEELDLDAELDELETSDDATETAEPEEADVTETLTLDRADLAETLDFTAPEIPVAPGVAPASPEPATAAIAVRAPAHVRLTEFVEELDSAIEKQPASGQPAALLLVELSINGEYGTTTEEEVAAAGARLLEIARYDDVIFRIGAAVLAGIMSVRPGASDLSGMRTRLVQAVAAGASSQGREVTVRSTVVRVDPGERLSSEDLVFAAMRQFSAA